MEHGLLCRESEAWSEDVVIESDNRELVDAGNENQQLTTDDIERMKEEGRSGLDIIEALKEKSVTFATKTKFSQVISSGRCGLSVRYALLKKLQRFPSIAIRASSAYC